MRMRLMRYSLAVVIIAHHGFQLGSAHAAPGASFKIREEVRITMSDGIQLSADLYLPKGPKPIPVVLVRTPYGKRQPRDKVVPTG